MTRTTPRLLPWRILRVLDTWPGAMHYRHLASLLQVEDKYMAICCARMVRDGRLAHVGYGLYGRREESAS